MVNIYDICNTIQDKLGIKNNILIKILEEKKISNLLIDDKLKDNIDKLFEIDNKLNDFINKNINKNTQENLKIFRENLGKLQILVLIKKLNELNDSTEIIKSFIDIFNKKITNVNNILLTQLDDQKGGNIDYNFKKYIKYKKKYLILKFK